MKIRDFILSLVSWFILLVTVSCSDELGGERAPISSESNLHVLVPTVLSSRGTRTDDASGLPTYNATVDECQINDLTLYAFPVPTGNGNDGKLLVETLPAPLATMMLKENVASYQLNIQPGTYHIYVVANMSDVLKDQNKNIDSEEMLKNIVLHYGGGTKPGMPVCTNIPMIYEPEKETKITPTGNKYTEVIANMKFTCVKVKLNLIFDPTQADVNANFGGKPIIIDNIVANKLSPFTNLYWGGKFVEESLADDEYKSGISSNLYDSKASDAPAVYYTDWEDHTLEAETNNKNDIVGKGDATSNLVNPAGKWLFQSTYYLPERYISSAADRSYLTIKGKVANSIANDYRIDLGHKKDETSNSEVPTFPRGTYYEITGKIKSLGNMTLDCNVSIKPWESVKIDADFNHTTLWVSKTKANVTSMKNDYITYNSNAGTVGFGCDTKINSNDIIIGTKRGKDANGNDSIEFRVNPNIPIKDYAEEQRKGTAKFWIKANNLKKYIDVDYDVTPYLDVTKELVIYYNRTEPENNKRTIKWDTNLGGIVLDRITDTNTITDTKGNSIIKMSLASSDAATGTFMVTATKDPVTTTIHEFTVKSKDGSKSQTVRVTVSPPIGDYRICFRAINDRSIYDSNKNDDSRKEVDFMAIKEEGGTNNWYDGWDNNGGADSPKEDNHRIYVYTQIGETKIESGNLPNKGKWIYTDGDTDKANWPGETMTADKTNTGWYYKDFKVDMEQKRKMDTQEDRKIKPGETLIMFNNNKDTGAGYTLHRCPHHREPGIPLFDYEDHEGWIVYDPTSDPEYHIFDDMPEIVNLNITIYTEKKTMGWYRVYGVAGSSKNDQFKIKDEITDANVDHGNSWKREKKGNWWKTVITLKAIKGEHNKDIKIKQQDGDVLTLFNGNSFKDDTGYYQNGKWYQGKPNGVTE